MNKKLIALMIVPIMLTLSGAMAYSAFTGQISTTVNATAGHITIDQTAEITGYHTHKTNITVEGGFGTYSNTVYILNGNLYNNNDKGPDTLSTVPNSGYLRLLGYYVNVSNLAPGNWVTLTLSISVGPGVGVILNSPSVGSVALKGTDLNLSNVSSAAGGFSASKPLKHESDIFNTGSPLTGVHSLLASDGNYTYASNDPGVSTGPGSSPTSGYAFAII